MRTFSERLRWARAATGLSARRLGVAARLPSNRHIGFLESGQHENPALKTLQALAGALGVTVGWLANGEGRKPAAKRVRATALSAYLAAVQELKAARSAA